MSSQQETRQPARRQPRHGPPVLRVLRVLRSALSAALPSGRACLRPGRSRRDRPAGGSRRRHGRHGAFRPGCIRWLPLAAAALYLCALLRLTVLKFPARLLSGAGGHAGPLAHRLRFGANFVPFRTLAGYLAGDPSPRIALENLAGNVILFVPWGFLWAWIFPGRARARSVALAALLGSLAIECGEFVLGAGQWDVDDLLLNVLGALLGLLAFRVLRGVWPGAPGRGRAAGAGR